MKQSENKKRYLALYDDFKERKNRLETILKVLDQ